jgi:hypothetical protein
MFQTLLRRIASAIQIRSSAVWLRDKIQDLDVPQSWREKRTEIRSKLTFTLTHTMPL